MPVHVCHHSARSEDQLAMGWAKPPGVSLCGSLPGATVLTKQERLLASEISLGKTFKPLDLRFLSVQWANDRAHWSEDWYR